MNWQHFLLSPQGRLGRQPYWVMILISIPFLATLLVTVAAIPAGAADVPHWAEYFKVFAAVRNETEQSIIAEADTALAPLGFRRDSSVGYPGSSGPGIFASYSASNSAAAQIIQASSPECLTFSAKNDDRNRMGLVDRAGAAIESRFRAAFGPNVQFYSDAKCRVAL